MLDYDQFLVQICIVLKLTLLFYSKEDIYHDKYVANGPMDSTKTDAQLRCHPSLPLGEAIALVELELTLAKAIPPIELERTPIETIPPVGLQQSLVVAIPLVEVDRATITTVGSASTCSTPVTPGRGSSSSTLGQGQGPAVGRGRG